jgi:phage shock protein A
MEELEASGAFGDDMLELGSGQDQLDKELHQLTSQSQVDDDLARLRAELGSGTAPAGQLGAGEPSQTESKPEGQA